MTDWKHIRMSICKFGIKNELGIHKFLRTWDHQKPPRFDQTNPCVCANYVDESAHGYYK